MHHLILYQSTNKKFRKDSKYVFTPESEALEAFIKERGETVERYPINGNQWDKDAVKADLIDACLTTIDKKVDVFHCLCHGWKTGFQFGFKGRSGARLLGSLIGSLRPKYVNLYACLTGKGTDNFANGYLNIRRFIMNVAMMNSRRSCAIAQKGIPPKMLMSSSILRIVMGIYNQA